MFMAVVAEQLQNHKAVLFLFKMVIKISKEQTKNKIEEFFKGIKNKTPKEIKKIKKLAMSKNIPLKENRKLFCGKCFVPHTMNHIKIKKGIKTLECENCGHISRWNVK
jgi:RNase P subunit RPR2